jgi:hypothetical protein
MNILILIFALTAPPAQTQKGTIYNYGNSSRGLGKGFNYYRNGNVTRQETSTPQGKQTITGQGGIYSNGVRRQTSGNHTYDYGTYNRMGISRPYGGGTRTHWSNGQVDTQRGIQFEHRNFNQNFPIYNPRYPR